MALKHFLRAFAVVFGLGLAAASNASVTLALRSVGAHGFQLAQDDATTSV